MTPNRTFVDSKGVIFTMYPNGSSNHAGFNDGETGNFLFYQSLTEAALKNPRLKAAEAMGARFFVDQDGVIFTVHQDLSTNFDGHLEIRNYDSPARPDEAWQLGEDEGNGQRLVIDEHPLWNSLAELAEAIEGQMIA